jgi:hypothetical protein
VAATKSYNGFPPAYREKQGGAVYRMFKSGKLKRPTECVGCGALASEGAPIMAHNEDYHQPLNYVGICFGCHMAIHIRFNDIETWKKWCDLTADGWQPPYSRDYKYFIETWRGLKHEVVEKPSKLNWLHSLPYVEPNLYNKNEGQLWDA